LYGTAEKLGGIPCVERYRYTEWLEGRACKELYDHANDSEEVTNLADYSEHEELIASLSKQLKPSITLKPKYRTE
jgi:hypothetical protein